MKQERLEILKQKTEEIKKLKKDFQQTAKNIFFEMSKDIFNDHPKLESFGWSQYTPYFNDGDTCIFRANTEYIKINEEDVDDSDWISENNVISWGIWDRVNKTYDGRVEEPNPNYDKDLAEATSEVKEFLDHFDNDFYLSQFGDHSEITIKRSGEIVVDEYEHD
jgi:hypothetical protein